LDSITQLQFTSKTKHYSCSRQEESIITGSTHYKHDQSDNLQHQWLSGKRP